MHRALQELARYNVTHMERLLAMKKTEYMEFKVLHEFFLNRNMCPFERPLRTPFFVSEFKELVDVYNRTGSTATFRQNGAQRVSGFN